MANLVLAFGELLAGGVLLDAAIKGESIPNIISGAAGTASASTTSTSTTTSGATSNATGSGVPRGSTLTSASTTPAPAGGSTVVGDVTYGDLQAIAKAHGWTTAQVEAWAKLIPLESNGTISDTNTSSGAYGIAQFINGPSEYATYGGTSTSVMGQLTAMANYIAQRYGNPAKALWFHTTPTSAGGSIDSANPGGWY